MAPYQLPLLRTMILYPYLLQHTFGTIKLVFAARLVKKDNFDGAKCMLQLVQAQEHGTEKWQLMRRQFKQWRH